MIEYTNFNDYDSDNEPLQFVAEDQCWDKATLNELKEKYNVIFMSAGEGVTPVMVIDRGNNGFHHCILVLGGEDDGCISFQRSYGQFVNTFHSVWAKYLIADIQDALKLCEELNKK